jgi:hypothetical protein
VITSAIAGGIEMRDMVVQPDHEEAQPKIIDLAGLPLEALLNPQNAVLAGAMRRATEDLIGPSDNYSAHGSSPMK